MYVIMVDIPEKLKDFLTLKFLSLGLELYVGETNKNVEKIMEKKGAGFLFLHVNQLNSPWLQFIARIRQYKREEDYKLIILSDKSDRDFIQTLLLINVTGLIPGKLEKEVIYTRLHKIVNSGDIQHEQREFQRVAPRETDEITMNLSVPNSSQIITGTVINLSIGGVAMQLANINDSRMLKAGQVIASTQMRLNGKVGITGIKIMAVKENAIGVRFNHPSDHFSNLLGRYLLERLSKG